LNPFISLLLTKKYSSKSKGNSKFFHCQAAIESCPIYWSKWPDERDMKIRDCAIITWREGWENWRAGHRKK